MILVTITIVEVGCRAGRSGDFVPVRLGCEPLPEDRAVWRQVVNAFHVAEPLALSSGVLMVDRGVIQLAALSEHLAVDPAQAAMPGQGRQFQLCVAVGGAG